MATTLKQQMECEAGCSYSHILNRWDQRHGELWVFPHRIELYESILYIEPRHVVVIGSQQSAALQRCEASNRCCLSFDTAHHHSSNHRHAGQLYSAELWTPAQHPTGISVSCISKWMVGRIMQHASGGNNMVQHCLCACVLGSPHVCFL